MLELDSLVLPFQPSVTAIAYGLGVRTHQIQPLCRRGAEEAFARLLGFGPEDSNSCRRAYQYFLVDRIDRITYLVAALRTWLQSVGMTSCDKEHLAGVKASLDAVRSLRVDREYFRLLPPLASDFVTACRTFIGPVAGAHDVNLLEEWYELGAVLLDEYWSELVEDQLAPWDQVVIDFSSCVEIDFAEFSDVEESRFDWRSPQRVTELMQCVGVARGKLLPTADGTNDLHRGVIQRVPSRFPLWFHIELGLESLLSPPGNPRDPRDDLFLKWYMELGEAVHNRLVRIQDRWNAMTVEVREGYAPDCTGEVSTQTVKKSLQRARERRATMSSPGQNLVF